MERRQFLQKAVMGSEYLAGWMFLVLTILLMAGFPITFILIGANAFGLTFRELNGDELIRGFLLNTVDDYNKWVVLAIVMGVIFLIGFVLDF